MQSLRLRSSVFSHQFLELSLRIWVFAMYIFNHCHNLSVLFNSCFKSSWLPHISVLIWCISDVSTHASLRAPSNMKVAAEQQLPCATVITFAARLEDVH